MLRVFIFAVAVFILLKVSTVGWHFGDTSFLGSIPQDENLPQRLKQHVYKLSHEIGDRSVFNYERLNEAGAYIESTFKSFGYNVEFQEYKVHGLLTRNIIAVKEGGERKQEFIIVGAHYDTCFNPGADDNASGVGGLLELARFMADERPNRSIKFIAFVNEEPPFFKSEQMGSRVYAKAAKQRGEDIKATLILESIGYYSQRLLSQRYPIFFGPFYPNRGNFIGVVGNFNSRWLVKKIAQGFRKQTAFPIASTVTFGFVPGIDFSDHWSFWKEGYAAAMITDTAFYRNPHYHSNSDTYDTLDYDSYAEVVTGLSRVLRELAK